MNNHLCIIKRKTKTKNMTSKIVSLFVACVLSVTAFAKTPSMSVASSSASVYNVYYKSTETGNVKVSILNKNNVVVFSETLTNVSSFKRPYNFSNLEQGEYTIVLEDKAGKQVEKVSYYMNKVNTFIHVSEMANDDSKYMLNVTNDGSEDVYVKIYNENGMLHEQQLKVTGTFGLIYNLSLVKSVNSKITFEITTSSGKIEKMTF